jgi:phosphohistidine phosphatase
MRMQLILWRHADAEDGAPDLERRLTAKGHEDAAAVARWMLARLPPDFELVASPAVRAQQTAAAMQRTMRTDKRLAPGASVDAILAAAGWPSSSATVVVVGHQPDFGCAVAFVLSGKAVEWAIPKAGLWWLSNDKGLTVSAVMSPDLL